MLHPLLRRFGPRRVWVWGEKLLGYPPDWITSGLELWKLETAFSKGV